jgi:CDP-6-deoxy-D-xylo-4-hexulose-3-dehydrase
MDSQREDIMELVRDYYARAHRGDGEFRPGVTPVPVAGRVYDADDMCSLVDSSLDFWLTAGRFNDEFEEKFGQYLGVKYALSVNSGSSANLLALAALTSGALGDKALRPGDEVITVAAGFPTTVNPILLYGCVPVFVDIGIPSYNIGKGLLEGAVTDRTRAIMLAHTLGNPFDLDEVLAVARKHDLWVLEDCCDALGTVYKGQKAGTLGHIGTFSFYPAHHITMGEGGAVVTGDPGLGKVLMSMRDWGRDCWCPPGRDDTCKARFDRRHGKLPEGYDHKYVYSHLGYNLKITDMQAAVGVSQMGHLEDFTARRRENFSRLAKGLAGAGDHLILPEATKGSEPSWFGFPITLRDGASFKRDHLIRHLNERKIATRLLFGGNLTCQPYMEGREYRIHGSLVNTDKVMRDTLWIGVYPGLTGEMLDYVAETMLAFLRAEAG